MKTAYMKALDRSKRELAKKNPVAAARKRLKKLTNSPSASSDDITDAARALCEMLDRDEDKNVVLLAKAIDLLEDADDTGCDGMVTVSNKAFTELQAAVKGVNGNDYGIDVSDQER
jgi:hypothetical protein